MNCPKCHNEMETIRVSDIEIDRCVACGGLWFDEFELEQLKEDPAAGDLDAKAISVDPDMRRMGQIRCPRCEGTGKMLRMVDIDQPHIWFESCPVCHGVFLDAGEFQDLREHTLVDYVRDMFARERR